MNDDRRLSDNGMIATWACVLCIFLVGIVAATYFNAIQNGNITNAANAINARAAEQKETNLQAVRVECVKAGRIWIETVAICIPKDAKDQK